MNVFPVAATPPDGQTVTTCRLWSDAPGEATVYVWNGTTGEARWSGPVTQNGPRAWTIESADGPVTVVRSGGCGCSTPMRRWVPGGRPVRAFDER